MQQEVSWSTYGGETLDLVLDNNHELVIDVSVHEWADISDHKLVKVRTNFVIGRSKEVRVEQHLTATAARYK